MNSKYNELIPDDIVDSFYNRIKKHIENGEKYDYLIKNLLSVNANKIPVRIKELINMNKKPIIKKFHEYKTDREFTIFCDMDGVLTNFLKSFEDIEDNVESLDWDTYVEMYGHTKAWNLIDSTENNGLDWWVNLPWKDDGKKLWNYILKYDPIILSAPSRNPTSSEGKMIWCARELEYIQDEPTTSVKKWEEDSKIILSSDKYMFAKRYPNSILIDDTPKKIKDWKENGGIGILHTGTKSTIKKLEKLIKEIQK